MAGDVPRPRRLHYRSTRDDEVWLDRAVWLNEEIVRRNTEAVTPPTPVKFGDRRKDYVWTKGDPLAQTLWQRLDHWSYQPVGARRSGQK